MLARLAIIVIAQAIGLTAFLGAAAAQKQGGTLRIYHRDNPPSTSLLEESTISAVLPFANLYNNLVVFDPKKPENRLDTIVPDLAKSWSWDESQTKLTFQLNEGVKWHDGKPFTAKDVQCTWYLLTGKISNEEFRKNPRQVWYVNLDDVTVSGDYEVTFKLKEKQPSFLMLLASGFSVVYPCHVSPRDMRVKPIGTGPFKLAEFKRNESIRLVRNPDYFKKGKPYLDAIEMKIIENRSTRILAFVSGQFDMTFRNDLTVQLFNDVKQQLPNAQCDLGPSGTLANLMVNRTAPPFDNADIRKAMSLALDREAFINILSQGKSTIGGAMLAAPDGQWAMPPEVLAKLPGYDKDIDKNVAEGRRIMEGLGYTAAKPLAIKVATRNLPEYRDPSVILIDQLRRVNIAAELEPIDTTQWYAKMTRKDYMVGLNVTGVPVDDPDVNLIENYTCKSERNYTQYCNADVDSLIYQQSRETDIEKRKRMVWYIEKALADDVARPVISHGYSGTCWQPYVKGYVAQRSSIYNNDRLEDVWLER